MINIFNAMLKFYANKYYVVPAALTLIFSVILYHPYMSSNNFDMVVTFFTFTAIISSLLLCIFFE